MKERKQLTRLLALFLAIVMIVGLVPVLNIHAAENVWEVSADTDIFWVKNADSEKNFEELSRQVQLFSSELAEKYTGTALDIVYGESEKAGTNDIVLVLNSSLDIAAQGFEISVSGSSVTISASDDDGLFYGCRNLIKQLMLSGAVSDKVDRPDVAERAVSLDNGRKYYSVEWIKEFIREMSWSNMNALALHFSEEMGLGLESKLYPWLNGRDGDLCTQESVVTDNRYLTQDEMADIAEYAKLYHIELIPSLDSPGHMNYIVKKFNEQCANKDFSFTYRGKTYTAEAGSEIGNYFHYNGQTTIVKGSRNPNYSRGIDISNEVAVAFTRSLIEEYATFFAELGATKFDIGGDELLGWGSAVTSSVSKWMQLDHWKQYAQNRAKSEGKSNWQDAVAYDGFIYYMNDLNDLVRELGYTSVRMWNDDALRYSDTGWNKVAELDTDIDIWFWTTGKNIYYDYAVADYQLYNIISDYNYYAMTADFFSSNRGSFAKAYPDLIYNEWNPSIFYPDDLNAGWKYNPSITNPNILGGAFGVWSDNPMLRTEEQVMEDLLPLVRANAVKSWDADANVTIDYDTYVENQETIGDAPLGNIAAPEVYMGADLTALKEAVAEFAAFNESDYTAASFAAYRAAVVAGEALLNSEYPLQQKVDAAVEAIENAKSALVEKAVVDIAELQAAIAAYQNCDGALYTGDSFAAYTLAVHEAEKLLARDDYSADDVMAALTAINDAVDALVPVEEDAVACFLGGASKYLKVDAGRNAYLTVHTVKSIEISGFRIFDDTGKEIILSKTAKNERNAERNTHTLLFGVTKADIGVRTYTVYAVLSDGSLSADSVKLSFEVRG